MRAESWSSRFRGLALASGFVAFALSPGAAWPAEPCPAGTRNMLDAAKRRESDDLAGAVRDYATLVEGFGPTVCGAEAMARLSLARYERLDDPAGAEGLARRLISEHSTTRHAAAGHVLVGRILEDRAVDADGAESARDQFRGVWLLFPPAQYSGLEARAEARVRFGELSYRLGDDLAAGAAFLSVVEDEAFSALRPRALLGLAGVLLADGDWESAAELLQEAADEDARSVRAIARRRLTLLHRARIRPAAGAGSWGGTRSITAASLGLPRIQLVAAHEDGRLLVGGGSGGDFAVTDAAGKVVRRAKLAGLGDLFFTPDGRPFGLSDEEIKGLSDADRGGLSRPIGGDGKPLKDFRSAVPGPFGGWLLVAEKRYHRFDESGAHGSTRGEPGSLQPVSLALGPRQRAYLLDTKADRVLRLEDDGVATPIASSAWKRPAALALDAMGRLYVLDTTAGITVFGIDGEVETTLSKNLPGGLTLKDPVDLAVDGEGRLYIADRGLKALVILE